MKIAAIIMVIFPFVLTACCCCVGPCGEETPVKIQEPEEMQTVIPVETQEPLPPEPVIPEETLEPLPTEPVIPSDSASEIIGSITNILYWVQAGAMDNLKTVEGTIDLQNHDAVKVTDGGQASLELYGPIVLLLYNDSEMQDLTTAEVDPGSSSPRYAGRLIRGGMSGSVEPGNELTIDLAYGRSVTVLGTRFFIVNNDETGYITVGKFDGTLRLNILNMEPIYLDSELVDISPDNNLMFYPLPFSYEELVNASTDYKSLIVEMNILREQYQIPTPGPTPNIILTEPPVIMPEPAPVYADWQKYIELADNSDGVLHAYFSPDGNYLVTTSYDRTARLYNTSTWESVVLPHDDVVWNAAFSPDSRWLATASADRIVRIWETSSGEYIHTLSNEANTWNVSFNPDGSLVATAGGEPDFIVSVWTNRKGGIEQLPPRRSFGGHTGNVWVAAFSPDGQKVLSASSDATARIWNIQNWETPEFVSLIGHTDWIPWAEFSRDGQYVVTASGDRTARVWSIDGSPISVLSGHSDTVWYASFSPDGNSVVTASGDGLVRIYDVWSGQIVTEIPGHSGGVVTAVYSPNGEFIASASVDGTGMVYEINKSHSVQLIGHSGRLYSIAFSPDSNMVVTSGDDGKAIIWVRVQ